MLENPQTDKDSRVLVGQQLYHCLWLFIANSSTPNLGIEEKNWFEIFSKIDAFRDSCKKKNRQTVDKQPSSGSCCDPYSLGWMSHNETNWATNAADIQIIKHTMNTY